MLGLTGFWADVAHIVHQHAALSAFVGTLATGELAILLAVLFAAQSGSGLYAAIAGSLAAVLVTDFFWFFIGRLTRRIGWLQRYYAERLSARLKKTFERLFERHMLQSLILLKYIYGLRLLSLVWLGFRREEKLLMFVGYDVIGASVYLAVLIAIALAASAGIDLAVSLLHIIAAASIAILALYLVYHGARAYLSRISDT